MKKRRVGCSTLLFTAFTAGAVLLGGGSASACDGEVNPDPATSLRFISPQDGDVLESFDVTVIVQSEESEAGALTPLDHIHWGVGTVESGEGPAALLTMASLTGDSLFLGDEAPNGEYEICAYLARIDHSHLSDMECVRVTIAVSGADLYLPKSSETYTSCDVPLNYSFFAHTNFAGNQAARVRYQVSGGEEEVRTESSMSTFLTLPNGEHTLTFHAEEQDGDVLGRAIERTFTVDSPMSVENACYAKKLARRGSKRRARGPLRRSAAALIEMAGTCSQHPTVRTLSNKKINRLIRDHRKAMRGDKKLSQKSLRLMSRQCRGK